MRKKILSLLIVVILTFFIFETIYPNHVVNSSNIHFPRKIHLATEAQWLENNDFSSQQYWFFTKGDQGDNSSVDADISGGKANFRVLGETKTFNLYGVPNSTDSPDWYKYEKPGYYLPSNSWIDSSGCYVDHVWSEGSNQFPGVHFRKNISITVDMSKYNIISASIDVIFNASVNSNVDVEDDNPTYYAIGDFVTFYVLISDVEFKNSYTIALNKTKDLGRNTGPLTITDKLIESYSQSVLITAINSALEKDPDHSNFTITLGIDIYSEDSTGSDTDTFNYLRIKDCNLTFTYERKIERFTSISCNQIGDQVSGENVLIKAARFYFDYSVNETWPYELSPFSEIRVLINNNQYRETIQLSSATLFSQQAIFEGIDFTSYFFENVNISVSFQLFIANTFGLNRTITISIDDVFLYITYTHIKPEANLSPLVIGLTVGIIGLVTAFSLYQFHFKYPPLIRKIRKLRKKVRKSKKTKPILVNKRDEVVRSNFQSQMKFLNIELTQLKK